MRADPWAVASAQLDLFSDSVDGRGSACVVLAADTPQPQLGGIILRPTGFPFLGQGGRWQAFGLPFNSDYGNERQDSTGILVAGDLRCELCQRALLPRPDAAADDAPKASQQRDEWLRWQIQRYHELGDHEQLDQGECALRNGYVRRRWPRICREWVRPESEEPPLSLIVRLASNKRLLDALDHITAGPRRVLERYRDNTPIGRIEEVDAACIRDYARRPGRTSIEKGGPTQRLLSIRRRERTDTLENQVTHWVLRRLLGMARKWLYQHSRFAESAANAGDRVPRVQRLSTAIRAWLNRPSFEQVGRLHHLPTGPNYPLQFESRYMQVWQAYLAIRREDKVFEDAWTWQRTLWSETGRQLFHSLLIEHWQEVAESAPIYRNEGVDGTWLLPYRAPGPFRTPAGQAVLYDAMDLHQSGLASRWPDIATIPDADRIGQCGCEQILWLCERDCGIAIWYALHEDGRHDLAEMAQNARRSLSACTSSASSHWVGLVVCAAVPGDTAVELSADCESFSVEGATCIAISIPMDAHRQAEDIAAGVSIALDAIGGI